MSSGSELELSENSNSMSVQSAMDSAYFSSSPGMQPQVQVLASHGSGNTGITDVHIDDKALIRCRLFQSDKEEEHVHELVIGQPGTTDVSQLVPENGSYTVCFRGMGIIHKSKKKVEDLLFRRNDNMTRAECKKLAAAIDPNVFRLRFSAHDVNTDEEICPPVYSELIKDSKSPASNELMICKYSKFVGRAHGGEDVFLLVNKVSSDNIKIRFFELNDCGERIWTTELSLMKDDVHNQFAIVFRTPPYKDVNITKDKKVYMELFRPSDGSTSLPREYIYKPESSLRMQEGKKRKLNSSHSAPGSSPSSVSGNTAQIVSAVPVTTIELKTEDYEAQMPQKYPQSSAIPNPQSTGIEAPQNNATQIPNALATPQMQQSYGMQFQQSSGIQMQGGIEYNQNIGAQCSQSTSNPPYQISIQEAQNTGTQCPQNSDTQSYQETIEQAQNSGIRMPQSGLQMIQEGQLPQNCKLPYSPASVEEDFNDSDWDILMTTLPLQGPIVSENDGLTEVSAPEDPVNNNSSLQLYEIVYPTPQPSPGNSTEPAAGAQSNNSDYRSSIMLNNPVMTSAATDDPDPARQQSIDLNFIDPCDLESFMSSDWGEYFATSDLQDGEHNFSLQRDSGTLKSDATKKDDWPNSKNLQQKLSSAETKISKKEYSAYYSTEDVIQVKKLIKEICTMIKKMDGYKIQEIQSKLERLLEMRLSNGDTFLHMTLVNLQVASFEIIVDMVHSFNVPHLLNLANDLQHTVLHIAVFNDKPRLIELLVAKGCDPMLSDLDGNNLIHHAVMCQTSLETLLEAIKKHKVAVDLNAYNFEKQTALHLAAVYDSDCSARMLLQHGASYNISDLLGRTPLHLAAYDDRLDVARALLDYIAPSDIDAVDGRGYTALQIVTSREIRENSLEILKLLLMKKADPMLHLHHNAPAYTLAKRDQRMWQIMEHYHELQIDGESSPVKAYEHKSADDDDFDDITTKFLEMILHEEETRKRKE